MTQVTFIKNAAGPTFGPYWIGDEVDLPTGVAAKLIDATSGAATRPWTPPPHTPNAAFVAKKKGDNY